MVFVPSYGWWLELQFLKKRVLGFLVLSVYISLICTGVSQHIEFKVPNKLIVSFKLKFEIRIKKNDFFW